MVTTQVSPVRIARLALGIPQSALAVRTGFSQTLISTIETGRRSLDAEAARRVAPSLGCSADDLLGGAFEMRVGGTVFAPLNSSSPAEQAAFGVRAREERAPVALGRTPDGEVARQSREP